MSLNAIESGKKLLKMVKGGKRWQKVMKSGCPDKDQKSNFFF